VNYLELLQSAPLHLEDKLGTCRVRHGLVDGSPSAEGVCDFRRRVTVAAVTMVTPSAKRNLSAGGWLDRTLLRGLTSAGLAKPMTQVFAGGAVFIASRQHGFDSKGPAEATAPRHPNDPVWVVDLLFGAIEPVRVINEQPSGLHLAAQCDFDLANQRCRWGVARPNGEGADSKWTRFDIEAWFDQEFRLNRIDNRMADALGRGTFWVTTEFWDFGTEVTVPAGVPPEAVTTEVRLAS